MLDPESEPRGSARIALANVFLAPTRCFQEIGRGAPWLAPLALTAALAVLGTILARPLHDAASQERMARIQAQNPDAEIPDLGSMQFVFAIVGVPIAILAMTALSAAVFLLVLRLSRVEVGYKRVFTGVAYAGIVGSGIAGLLVGLLVQLKARAGPLGGMDDMPRIGLDLLGGEGILRSVLGSISPFSVWWLVVLVYGFAALSGRSAGRVALPVLAAGLLWLLGGGALNGFFAGLGGG
jgi:hypothetical protein